MCHGKSGRRFLEEVGAVQMSLQAHGKGCIAGLLTIVGMARVDGHQLVAHVSRITLPQSFKEHGYGFLVSEELRHAPAIPVDFHGPVGTMALVQDLEAGPGRDDVTGYLVSGPVLDYQVRPVDSCVDFRPVSSVCAERQRIDVAVELDGVVLDDSVFVVGGPCQHRDIRQEIPAFVAPLLIRDLARGAVKHGVPRPMQPCFRFGIEILYRAELPVEKEVLLDILDGVLDLALALRVGRPAEDNPERAALHIGLEDCCHAVVSQMLVVEEDGILVVEDVAGYSVEVPEGLLVCLTGGLAGERPVAEPHELVAAAAQQHDHKIDLDPGAVSPAQPGLAEVYLSVLAGWRLGQTFVHPFTH